MLPPFIIEQIRQREQRDSLQPEQPRLELPLPRPHVLQMPVDEEQGRGVLILDI
jgi:hypothetical protein